MPRRGLPPARAEESIEVADVGVVKVGSDTSGGGGLIDGLEDGGWRYLGRQQGDQNRIRHRNVLNGSCADMRWARNTTAPSRPRR